MRFHEFLEKGKAFIKGIAEKKNPVFQSRKRGGILTEWSNTVFGCKAFREQDLFGSTNIIREIKMDHSKIILILKDIEERNPSY